MAELDDSQWQALLRGLRDGDNRAITEFCERYGPLLQRFAEKRLPPGLRPRVGPEDVVQSVCRTFLRRAAGGQFQLTESEDLWRLLCAITLNKVRQQARYHLRQKRGLDREAQTAGVKGDDSGSGFAPADPGPTPAEAAEFADQFEQLLATLDEEQRAVLDLRMQEHTYDEIAARLGISERTVRRTIEKIQKKLKRALDPD